MATLTTRQPSKGRANQWLTLMQPYISSIPCPKSLIWLIEMQGQDGAGEKLVNSVALTLIARAAMVIAAAALPLAGAMLMNVSQKIDAVREQQFEAGSGIKLIQQALTIQGRQIEDHEVRIRGAENALRSIPFRAN